MSMAQDCERCNKARSVGEVNSIKLYDGTIIPIQNQPLCLNCISDIREEYKERSISK